MLGVQTLLLAPCTQLLPCRTGCEESTFSVSAGLASLMACPWELASHFFLRSAVLREWARAEGGGRRMVGQVNS